MLVGDQLLLLLNISKIEIGPVPLVDRNNLENASIRLVERWLVRTIDRQEWYGVLKPEPLIVKIAGACLGLVYRVTRMVGLL